MLTRWAAIAATALVCTAPTFARDVARSEIEATMLASADGWNAGDVDRFLAIYSDRPETSFVTKQGLVRGKAAMRARYTAHYDFADTAKRGTLTFVTLDFRRLDPLHALYIGRYTLTYRDGKTESGPTSLVFVREKAGWRIIADHSS